MRTTMAFSFLAVCLVLPMRGEAADQLYGWDSWNSAVRQTGVADLMFSAQERDLIRSYFSQHGYRDIGVDADSHGGKPKKKKRLPPGLKKKIERGGELPPGWQRKLARGEVIDDELYAVSQDLPEGLLETLGGGPAGTEIRRIEDEVVRLIEATGVIVDVLGL